MSGRTLAIVAWLAHLVLLLVAQASAAREWPEELFQTKPALVRSFGAVVTRDADQQLTVIGFPRFYKAEPKDTLLDIGRYYDLGYNEIVAANPELDPWVPEPGHSMLLPTEWVLPDAEPKGLVVNIPEMRLYFFQGHSGATVTVYTFPVGLGRDDWRTPRGAFSIRGKTVNPAWYPTNSIKEEHRRDGEALPSVIPGGDPDNPLGKYRFELTLPLYGIHSTNIPWGVGIQVSHGCVRLYPEDMEHLFPMVKVGTPGQFIYQPVKIGMRERHVFIEVHKDIYGLVPGPYREAVRLIDKFGVRSRVDLGYVEDAVMEQSGVPVDVTVQPLPGPAINSPAVRPQSPAPRPTPATPAKRP